MGVYKEPTSSALLIDADRILKAPAPVLAVLARFADGLPREISKLKALVYDQDWDKVAFECHRLRGSAGTCGFREMVEHIAELEIIARNPDASESFPTKSIETHINALDKATTGSLIQFRALLNDIGYTFSSPAPV
jgi:HPt (histidine-containing phosphotransfer) domain-containing protein